MASRVARHTVENHLRSLRAARKSGLNAPSRIWVAENTPEKSIWNVTVILSSHDGCLKQTAAQVLQGIFRRRGRGLALLRIAFFWHLHHISCGWLSNMMAIMYNGMMSILYGSFKKTARRSRSITIEFSQH
jgi:hypothetical protein